MAWRFVAHGVICSVFLASCFDCLPIRIVDTKHVGSARTNREEGNVVVSDSRGFPIHIIFPMSFANHLSRMQKNLWFPETCESRIKSYCADLCNVSSSGLSWCIVRGSGIVPTTQENTSPEGPEVGRLRKLEWAGTAGSVVLHMFHYFSWCCYFWRGLHWLDLWLQGSHVGSKVVGLEVLDVLATPEELKFSLVVASAFASLQILWCWT